MGSHRKALVRLLALVAGIGATAAIAVGLATGGDALPGTSGAGVPATPTGYQDDCVASLGTERVMGLAVQPPADADGIRPFLGTWAYDTPGATSTHGASDPRRITVPSVSVQDGKARFDWQANLPVDLVIVTSGKDTWSYDYRTYDWGGHPATGPFGDTGVVAPDAFITSIAFCTLEKVRVELSAATAFTRAYDWKVVNAVAPSATPAETDFAKDVTLALATGGAGTATWKVVATRTGQHDEGFEVSGTVTVLDASSSDANLAAELTGLPTAVFTAPCAGGSFPLAHGTAITCPYTATVATGDGISATATIRAVDVDRGFLGNTSAAVTAGFTSPTSERHRSVRWTDDNGQSKSGITASDDAVTYRDDRQCDRAKGTHPVEVRLVAEDDDAVLSKDIARLEVTCSASAQPLRITASGRLTWKRVTTWSIAQVPVPASHALTGSQRGTSEWRIDVEKTGIDDYYLVTGTIDIASSNQAAVAGVKVAKPFPAATVRCALGNETPVEAESYDIPAGATLHCETSGPVDSAADGSATVTVTAGNDGTGAKSVLKWWGLPAPNGGEVNTKVTVEVPRAGEIWTVTDSTDGDRTLPETFPCRNARIVNPAGLLGDDPSTEAIETDFLLGVAAPAVTTTCTDDSTPTSPRIDLGIRITAPTQLPQDATGQTPIDYTLRFGNNGPHAAQNVVVTGTAPAGLTYTTIKQQPTQGSCTIVDGGRGIRCSLGTFLVRQGSTAVVGALTSVTGTVTNAVAVSGEGGAETNTANNTAQAQTLVVGPATPPTAKPPTKRTIDVAVVHRGPAKVRLSKPGVAKTFLYLYAYRNTGPSASIGTVSVADAPKGLRFVDVPLQPVRGICKVLLHGKRLVCWFGTVARSTVLRVNVIAAVSKPGTYTTTVAIRGHGGKDTDTSNNVHQTSIEAEAPPARPVVQPKPKPKPKPAPRPPVLCVAVGASLDAIPRGTRVAVTLRAATSDRKPLAGARLRILGPGIAKTVVTGADGSVATTLLAANGGIVTVETVGRKNCPPARIGVLVPKPQPTVTG